MSRELAKIWFEHPRGQFDIVWLGMLVLDGCRRFCRYSPLWTLPHCACFLSLVPSKQLHSPQMRVFAILVILKNLDLHEKRTKNRPLAPVDLFRHIRAVIIVIRFNRANIAEIDVYPASRLLEAHLCEFLDVVHAHSCEELDLRRRVRFVGDEVEIDSHVNDGDEFKEMDVQQMWLRSVRLPEQ